jgi:dinuclear metal center YbgI/SA1388 family protein
MTLLSKVLEFAEKRWPQALAEAWDSPGLVTGNPNSQLSKVLLSVDITGEILDEAIELGCGLIFAHHPFLLKPVNSVAHGTPKGSIISRAIENGIAIYGAHTNADVVENGVSDVFAKQLGLRSIRPLVPFEANELGHGRIGSLAAPVTLGDLALALARLLPQTASGVRVSGDFDKKIEKIALCGGAGDSFVSAAQNEKADVYITSDLRHHVVQEAREHSKDMAVIDVSHWASESLWLPVAQAELAANFSDISFLISEVRSDPWDFTVTQ